MNAKNVTPDDKAPDDAAKDAPVDDAAAPEVVAVEPVVSESTDVDAAAESGEVVEVVEAGHTGEVAPAPVQTVYVTAPTPPRPRGNRGMGTLLAVIAAIVFAAVYAGVAALLILFVSPAMVPDALVTFVTGPLYYVPVLAFLVVMILWVLLVNRASWWAWVIGSLVVGAVTYFASVGAMLLMSGGFGLTASQASDAFAEFATNPALVVAALLARETSIWFGAAIARRGRRVRERNYEAWQAFENEEARKRAEFGGVAAV